MNYTIEEGRIVYEDNVPQKYILSNLEITLELRRGVPHRLLSSKNGLLVEFRELQLPRPSTASLWPNGCEFDAEKLRWSFLTSAFVRSILWKIDGAQRLTISFKAPLLKEFKVPFGDVHRFKQPLVVRIERKELNVSDLLWLEVLEGKIEDFEKHDDDSFTLKLLAEKKKKLKIRFATSKENVDEHIENFTYNEFLKKHIPQKLDKIEKSLALFALHTALSNWKDLGPSHAFAAGVNYSFPPRTYFRDSFWTCMSVLGVRNDLIKRQILTLAEAVHDDGCPSGVMFLSQEEKALLSELRRNNPIIAENTRYDNDWWSDHHDSAFLFVLLVSKYLEATQDFSLLKERIGSDTIVEKILKILRHSERFVEDGLFKKPYDCKDWADNVFRNGYVTYDAALYVAALRCASKLLNAVGMREQASYFEEKHLLARKRFNRVLFDERKGHFVDFIGSYVEDHLSIDTVVSIIFDVADEEKALSSLLKMEQLLETRNNPFQPYGDWGVMNVWPHYRERSHLFGKSAFPYRYHNGSCWPYLSCAYALAKARYGLDYSYPLLSWWKYSLDKGWVNLVEYYSPCFASGSLHQAWSGFAAAVISQLER